MYLKKVRGSMMGFGETLVYKTCHFLGSHVRGGSLYLVFYGTKLCSTVMPRALISRGNALLESYLGC